MIEIRGEAKENLIAVLDVPLLKVLNAHDWKVACPEGADEQDAYEHMRRGRCLLCGELLGEDTVVIVDAQGILGLFCESKCLIDTHAISFLEELLTEMVSKYDPNEVEDD